MVLVDMLLLQIVLLYYMLGYVDSGVVLWFFGDCFVYRFEVLEVGWGVFCSVYCQLRGQVFYVFEGVGGFQVVLGSFFFRVFFFEVQLEVGKEQE